MGDLWTPMCLRNYHRPSLEDALVPNEAPCAPTEGRGERCPGTKKTASQLACRFMDGQLKFLARAANLSQLLETGGFGARSEAGAR